MGTKVALVTGANKGIGYAIVKLLMKRGFKGDVILTSRDEERGRAAVAALRREANLEPKYHQFDIVHVPSLSKMAEKIRTEYGGLDVLVNNAGMLADPRASFLDQAKKTVELNYYGTSHVCDALFPLLRPHARVVNVCGQLGHLSKIPSQELRSRFSAEDLDKDTLDELMLEFVSFAERGTAIEKGWGTKRTPTNYISYAVSKVAVAALTRIQQKKFNQDSQRKDLIVNAVCPGYVRTDMTGGKGSMSPDEGADPCVYMATLPPDVPHNPKGEFIWHDRRVLKWDSDSTPPLL